MEAAAVNMEVGHHQSKAIFQEYLLQQGVVEPDEDEAEGQDEDEAKDQDKDEAEAEDQDKDEAEAENENEVRLSLSLRIRVRMRMRMEEVLTRPRRIPSMTKKCLVYWPTLLRPNIPHARGCRGIHASHVFFSNTSESVSRPYKTTGFEKQILRTPWLSLILNIEQSALASPLIPDTLAGSEVYGPNVNRKPDSLLRQLIHSYISWCVTENHQEYYS
ncbi:hypothetical protein B0O80DRAFT_23387 [Mortierella sp. GBAus27b]|nr:hypothetical protein B0O80DRAFT_23387 [Mortierella sp. GBAus27b]